MKRLCALLIALLVLAMAVPAMATWTRVMTMGNQPMFIQDDYNIWQWTSTVNNYPRHMIVDHSIDAESYEFGTEDYDGSTRVGMVVPFMGTSVLGVFISDFDVDYPFTTTSFPGNEANQYIDVFYGYRGASWDLGVRIDYYNESVEAGGKQNQSQIGLNAGVGFNVNANMLEINAFYKSISWKNETLGAAPNDPITEKDAGSDIGIAARYLIAYNNMVTLIPAFAYRTQTVSETVTATVPPGIGNGEENKTTGWDLGIGCNTVPLSGVEFLTSLGVRSQSFEDTDTSSTGPLFDGSDKHFPYFAFGADIQVKNWLALRVGAEKTWDGFTDKTSTPETKISTSSFDYHIGAGIMLGDVQFDVDVNPGWLNAGPYFLSGESDGDMFTYVSFKYDYR